MFISNRELELNKIEVKLLALACTRVTAPGQRGVFMPSEKTEIRLRTARIQSSADNLSKPLTPLRGEEVDHGKIGSYSDKFGS